MEINNNQVAIGIMVLCLLFFAIAIYSKYKRDNYCPYNKKIKCSMRGRCTLCTYYRKKGVSKNASYINNKNTRHYG